MKIKKRYLALALFLIIGLVSFSFANPTQNVEKKDRKGTDVEKISNEKKEQNSYAEALEAVEKVEAEPTVENIEEARIEINAANDATNEQITNLQNRVEVAENSIDVAALVTELETLAESKNTLEEAKSKYSEVKIEVNKLNEGTVKDNLKVRLTTVSRLMNDIESPKVWGFDEVIPTNAKKEVVYVSDEFLTTVIIDKTKYTEKDFTKEGNTIKFQKNVVSEGTHTIVATDKLGNSTTKTFTIDRTVGEYTLTKSNNDKGTNEDVTITLKVSEPVATPDGWTAITEGTEFTKVYSANGKYEVVIKDKAGNEATIKFEVKRIDKVAPTAVVTKSNNDEFTKDDVTVTLVANEAIYKPEGWTEVKTNKEHEFTKVYSENGTYEVVIKDKAGNETTITFEVKNIDRTPATITVSDGTIGNNPYSKLNLKIYDANGVASVVINGTQLPHKGQYVDINDTDAYTYKEGINTVIVTDVAGNITKQEFNVDKTAPTLTAKEESIGTAPYYSKISFKLYDSNKIDYFEVNGTKFDRTDAKWSDANYQNIKSALIKGENEITLYDVAGNKTTKRITMDWSKPGKHSTTYSPKGELTTGPVTVTIRVNEQLLPVEGWTLSEDKKAISKSFDKNINGNVVISDLAGNTDKRYYSIKNIADKMTIEDITNASEQIVISKGKKVILNLEGKNIDVNFITKARHIKNEGTLIIRNGKITNNNTGYTYGLVDNYGTITLENVEIEDNGSGYGSTIRNRTDATMTLKNVTVKDTGTSKDGNIPLFIDGGTITIENSKFETVAIERYPVIINGGNVTINGNETNVKGIHGGLAVDAGKVEINGGTFDGDNHYGIWITNNDNKTEVIINDGTFIGGLNGLRGQVDDGKQDKGDVGITINGGNFSSKNAGKAAVFVNKDGSIREWTTAIHAGTFSTDVSSYLAETSTQTAKDGKFIVTKN